MKIKRLIVLVLVFMLGLTTFAYAEGIGQRIREAEARIDRGISSGYITREEAHRLNRELNNLLDDESRMRSNGRLDRYERERLHKELDRLERHINHSLENDNSRRPRRY